MTKEELAKKKGIKLPPKKETPAEALINNSASSEKEPTPKSVAEETKSNSKKATVSKQSSSKKSAQKSSTTKAAPATKKSVTDNKKAKESAPKTAPVEAETQRDAQAAAPIVEKRGVGKPKKRKPGDKKLSLWIDEDLVDRMYNNLSYGDSAGELLNKALQEYLDNHNLH